jgi:hypothetical protein
MWRTKQHSIPRVMAILANTHDDGGLKAGSTQAGAQERKRLTFGQPHAVSNALAT